MFDDSVEEAVAKNGDSRANLWTFQSRAAHA
jgi:hypothetical protein